MDVVADVKDISSTANPIALSATTSIFMGPSWISVKIFGLAYAFGCFKVTSILSHLFYLPLVATFSIFALSQVDPILGHRKLPMRV